MASETRSTARWLNGPLAHGHSQDGRAKLLHRAATVPLRARQLPDERSQPGPIPVAVLHRQLGFQETSTPGTTRLVQHDMHDGHADLGQLDMLVGIVGRRRGELRLSTGTALRFDLDDLCGGQQGLAMPRVPWPGARSALRARTGRLFLIGRIGGGRTIGIAGALLQAGLECREPRFKGLDLFGLLLDDHQQMDDQLPHDEGRLFPAGRIQRQPFWQEYRGSHDTPSRTLNLATAWRIDAAFIEKKLEKFQQKVGGMPPSLLQGWPPEQLPQDSLLLLSAPLLFHRATYSG